MKGFTFASEVSFNEELKVIMVGEIHPEIEQVSFNEELKVTMTPCLVLNNTCIL